MENLHAQVADDLVRRVCSGALTAGSVLPPEAELAAEYGINSETLRRALDHLLTLRLVERRTGRRMTVADVEGVRRVDATISTTDAHGNRIFGDTIERNVRVEIPSAGISLALRHRTPRPVLRFDRLRSHLGRRYMVEDVYLPVRHADLEGDQDHLEGLARDLWWKREIAQARYEKLWLERAAESDTGLLGIPLSETVVCIERLLFGTRNLPLEYRIGRCNFGPDLFHVSH